MQPYLLTTSPLTPLPGRLCEKYHFHAVFRHFERSEKSHSGFGSVVEGDFSLRSK